MNETQLELGHRHTARELVLAHLIHTECRDLIAGIIRCNYPLPCPLLDLWFRLHHSDVRRSDVWCHLWEPHCHFFHERV